MAKKTTALGKAAKACKGKKNFKSCVRKKLKK